MGNKLLRAIKAEFLARKEKAEANLTIYLNTPVGVGEHSKVVEEMVSLVENIHDADGCISTIDNIVSQAAQPSAETDD